MLYKPILLFNDDHRAPTWILFWERPCLGQACMKIYTLFRTQRPKTMPCPVACPCLVHIRGYSPHLSLLRSRS